MSVKKRVGIMGGTFNPIHLGHLTIGECAYEELSLDEVLFIPCGTPYMKDYKNILDVKTRVNLVREAINDNSHFTLSTIEADRSGNTYSYETIEELKKSNPDTEYYFLIGGDSLYAMENWMHPERIFSQAIIAVAVRSGYDENKIKKQIKFLENKYQAKIIILKCREIEISSTEIRERVKSGKSIRYMVKRKTEQMIRELSLYID